MCETGNKQIFGCTKFNIKGVLQVQNNSSSIDNICDVDYKKP